LAINSLKALRILFAGFPSKAIPDAEKPDVRVRAASGFVTTATSAVELIPSSANRNDQPAVFGIVSQRFSQV
jgi:hypothetical protein